MAKDTFTFHKDAGHGWLEVGSMDLNKLGLKESDFSSYSYKAHAISFPTYYLEEDRDAGVFIERFKNIDLYKFLNFYMFEIISVNILCRRFILSLFTSKIDSSIY